MTGPRNWQRETKMADNYRMERIERLLNELRYEIERGMMENEVEEQLRFRFIVPISRYIKNGVVVCEFYTEPIERFHVVVGHAAADLKPKLRVIKGGKVPGPFITGSDHGPGDMG